MRPRRDFDPDPSDLTQRTIRLEAAERAGKRVQWWLQIVGGALVALVIACVKLGMIWSDVAHVGRVIAVENRQTIVETKLDMVLQQQAAIARRVGAPVVAPAQAVP